MSLTGRKTQPFPCNQHTAHGKLDGVQMRDLFATQAERRNRTREMVLSGLARFSVVVRSLAASCLRCVLPESLSHAYSPRASSQCTTAPPPSGPRALDPLAAKLLPSVLPAGWPAPPSDAPPEPRDNFSSRTPLPERTCV